MSEYADKFLTVTNLASGDEKFALGWVWAVIIVALVIVIIVLAATREGAKDRGTSGASAKFNVEQTQSAVMNCAEHPATTKLRQDRQAKRGGYGQPPVENYTQQRVGYHGRERFAGSHQGPGFFGPNVGAREAAFLANQAQMGESNVDWTGGSFASTDVTQTAGEAKGQTFQTPYHQQKNLQHGFHGDDQLQAILNM